VPRTVERRGRFMRGVAKGLTHEAAEMVHINGHPDHVDDETLVARVRSEVLRDRDIKAGEIHIDAYEGCVTLRGQLPHAEDIRYLIEATKRVEGVREVRSYLHLPGTLPPNKAESYVHVPPEYARR
jgi:osmotically-inducible protein OsmY